APADEGTPPAAYRVESNGKSGRAVRYLIKDAEDKQVGEEYTSKKAANEAFEALTSEASK
ncbi:MAG: hypothetical protein CMC15_18725, partial [Flavobacteriaceae bacterium]|nr:hypothetical protein [Flavobacteriaceae bacterium]